jgi:hypothetical protein
MDITHHKNLTMLADFLLKDASYYVCPIEQKLIIKFCEKLIEEAEANNFQVMPKMVWKLPNDMLAVFLIYFTHCQHAKRDGLPIVPKMTLEHFEYTRSSINSSDGSFSTHGETMESIYKRIAKGELEKAGASYRRLIADVTESAEVKKEAETHSKFKSKIAKNPRTHTSTPFQQLIFDLVTQDQSMSEHGLNIALRRHGVDFNADGDTATYQGEIVTYRGKPLKISLKDQLYRAKKRIDKINSRVTS